MGAVLAPVFASSPPWQTAIHLARSSLAHGLALLALLLLLHLLLNDSVVSLNVLGSLSEREVQLLIRWACLERDP